MNMLKLFISKFNAIQRDSELSNMLLYLLDLEAIEKLSKDDYKYFKVKYLDPTEFYLQYSSEQLLRER